MKNTLVQYQGGGYDGCIWEWNYYFLDANNLFHDIFSSGHAGITTKGQAEELLESDNTFYTYDLTDDKAIEEFARECNVVNVTSILQWFEDNPQDGIEFFVLCSECGNRQTDLSELSLEEWHGCGGIQSTADKLICSECRSIGSCTYCGEYFGEEAEELDFTAEKIKVVYDLPVGLAQQVLDGFAPVCGDCLDTLLKHELERLIEKTKTRG